jgi:hypothetical protein
MRCNFARFAWLAAAILNGAVPGIQRSEASTTLYAIDPKAHLILNRMQTAYSSMNSLSETVTSEESPSVPHRLVVHTLLKIMRPGDLSITSDSKSSRSGSSQVVSDGVHCYVSAPQYPARYLKFTVSQSSSALLAAASEGVLSGFTVNLFANPYAVSALFSDRNLATLQCARPVKIGGINTDTVVLTDLNGVTLTLSIGQSDHLIRRIVAIDPNKPGEFTETYTKILVNPMLKSTDFTFTPPPKSAPFYGSSFDQAVQDSTNR